MRLFGVPFTTKEVSRFLPQIYMQYHASTQELMIIWDFFTTGGGTR